MYTDLPPDSTAIKKLVVYSGNGRWAIESEVARFWSQAAFVTRRVTLPAVIFLLLFGLFGGGDRNRTDE
jgi:hypothetical protein